jgi:hypothetical protein
MDCMSATPERSATESRDQSQGEPRTLLAAPMFLTLDQAALRAGLSRKAMRAEILAGNLRYVTIGKRKRFTAEDLAEFKERKRAQCPSVAGRVRLGSGMTSPSKVIGFAEAVRRTTGSSPRGSRLPTGRRFTAEAKAERAAGANADPGLAALDRLQRVGPVVPCFAAKVVFRLVQAKALRLATHLADGAEFRFVSHRSNELR